MKKFIALQITFVIISCVITKTAVSSIGDIGLIRVDTSAQELYDVDAFTNRTLEKPLPEYGLTLERFFELQQRMSETYQSEIAVLIVTALGRIDSYNGMYAEYVNVAEVIEGDFALVTANLKVFTATKGFYLEDSELFNRYIKRLPSLGYSKNEYPEFYEWHPRYRSYLNFLQDNARYLVVLHKVTLSGEAYYFYGASFSHFNLDSDYSIPVTGGIHDKYCKYSENEFFGSTQEVIDSFYVFKREILNYYLINSSNNVHKNFTTKPLDKPAKP